MLRKIVFHSFKAPAFTSFWPPLSLFLVISDQLMNSLEFQLNLQASQDWSSQIATPGSSLQADVVLKLRQKFPSNLLVKSPGPWLTNWNCMHIVRRGVFTTTWESYHCRGAMTYHREYLSWELHQGLIQSLLLPCCFLCCCYPELRYPQSSCPHYLLVWSRKNLAAVAGWLDAGYQFFVQHLKVEKHRTSLAYNVMSNASVIWAAFRLAMQQMIIE